MAESNKNHETIGAITGAGVGAASGIGGSVAAISTAGTVAGLSGSGIVTGLAALGGGSMVTGLCVATGGTAALVIGLGYAGFRIGKYFRNKN